MAILSDEFYYQPLRIDTINTRVYADLLAKEGDANGRGLLVTLTENGLMKDTTGIALNLKWEHTSVGNQGLDNFEAVDLSKGLYKITYPTEMLNRGKVRAFIQIIDSGKLAGTRNIEITVDRGVGDDTAIASSDSFTALAQALIEVNNLESTYAPRLLSAEQQLAQTKKVANVKAFGAKGDGVTDDSNAILTALEFDNNIYFPDGVYVVSFEGGNFYTFSNRNNIRLHGKGATIKCVETNDTMDLRNVFTFVNCKNVDIDINGEGLILTNVEVDIGYKGITLFYFENGCENITISSEINDYRYAVRSGNYTDATKGNCKNFKLRLKTNTSGYPFALYLADNIDVDIYATNVHRAGYLAGCSHVKGTISYGGFSLATANVLLTNSLTSLYSAVIESRTAKGCKDIDLHVIDRGSNSSQGNRLIAGISLQWVTASAFEDIHFRVHAKTNNVSRTLGAFGIMSRVKSERPEYSFSWSDDIAFTNIEVSGLIDRLDQTQSNSSWGDIYIEGYDVADNTHTHAPTFSSLVFKDLTILKQETLQLNTNIIQTPKLTDLLLLDRVKAKGINFAISTPQATTKIVDSVVQNISSHTSILNFIQDNSKIVSIDHTKIQHWKTPTLSGGWVNFGAPFQNTRYYKDQNNVVHLQGFIRGGTYANNTVLFTLEEGYRPNNTLKFAVSTATGVTTVNIASSGVVALSLLNVASGSNTWLTLTGIYFKA